MRNTRIYQPGLYQTGDDLFLSDQAAHHMGTVLRKKIGEHLTLFKGDNIEWDAQIISIQKKKVEVNIKESTFISRESPLQIHLAQAMSKGDKLDWILQKSVELGAHAFTPLRSAHAHPLKTDPQFLKKKQIHWEDIAISAVEQCGRNQLPLIHPPCHFETYLSTVNTKHRWILTPNTPYTFRNYALPQESITLLIGPEGGWSQQELDLAEKAGFLPLTLGPRILRTETAPLAALSLLQGISGDF